MLQSFKDVIALWPSPEALAADLGENKWNPQKWRTRNNIPADRWHGVVKAGKARGYDVSEADLARIAAIHPDQKQRRDQEGSN